MRKNGIVAVLLVTILSLAGCGGRTNMDTFLRDQVDLGYVLKVAVAPFENISKDQSAAERIRGMAITQILAQGLFDVVDKGLVDSALREEAVDLGKAPLDAGTLKRLGQRLNAQAFLLGTVDQAGAVQRGNISYPELSITLRLLDTNTGMILWQASGSRSGDSMGRRLFGLGSDDEFKIGLQLLRQILATISSERKVRLPVAAAPVAQAASVVSGEQAAPQLHEETEEQPLPPADQVDDAGAELPAWEQEPPLGEEELLNVDTPAATEVEAPTAGVVEEPAAEVVAPPGQEPPLGKEVTSPPPPSSPAPAEAMAPADAGGESPTTPTDTSLPSEQEPPAAPPVVAPYHLGEDEWPD